MCLGLDRLHPWVVACAEVLGLDITLRELTKRYPEYAAGFALPETETPETSGEASL